MKDLTDYHNLYLLTDVLLLADVLISFRNECLTDFNLDPFHSFTLPGFSWQAALKMTNIKLDLITDPDMYKFLEYGIRGGISTITRRHAIADTENSLIYLDANSLYGYAMSQPLPTGQFQFLTNFDNFSEEYIKNLNNNDDTGYIFECDLHYPIHLHDEHSDYPLAPEKMTVTKDMLSPKQISILQTMQETAGDPIFKTTEKLIPNLNDKHNYIIHYENLKLYLQLGLKLKKIHRVLQFRQQPWLKKYIDFNTNKRASATTEFQKAHYKMRNNSVFGKTMENVRKYKRITFVDSKKKAEKLIAQPFFKKSQFIVLILLQSNDNNALFSLINPYTAASPSLTYQNA